jgi:hypothetical protein
MRKRNIYLLMKELKTLENPLIVIDTPDRALIREIFFDTYKKDPTLEQLKIIEEVLVSKYLMVKHLVTCLFS